MAQSEIAAQEAGCSYHLRTRSAQRVVHWLGRPSPTSSTKRTLPGCVFSSIHVPSICCLDRSRLIASSIRRSGASPTERKYSRHAARRTSNEWETKIVAKQDRQFSPGALRRNSFRLSRYSSPRRRGRDGFRSATGRALVRQRSFENVDRGHEGRAAGIPSSPYLLLSAGFRIA